MIVEDGESVLVEESMFSAVRFCRARFYLTVFVSGMFACFFCSLFSIMHVHVPRSCMHSMASRELACGSLSPVHFPSAECVTPIMSLLPEE